MPYQQRFRGRIAEPVLVEQRIECVSCDVVSELWHINHPAHSLYLDQPVGVGFSYGDTTVGTSQQAAADVWTVGAP